MSSTPVVRVLAVIAAVGAGYLLLSRNADDNECRAAGDRVFSTSGGFEPIEGLRPAISDVRRHCEGAGGLLGAAETIRQAAERRPFLGPTAAALAREGAQAEPDNYIAWATLAVALARIDREGAQAALERARELNPRLRTPAALRSR